MLLPSAAAFAWGFEGHRIVSEIAARRIDPATLEKITELLDGQTIADVSTWADEVRNLPPYAYSRPYHYVNIAVGWPVYEPKRDCPGGDCVVAAIQKYEAESRDPATPLEKRKEALKFLIHFVQDLHQPLHASKTGDRGGNDIDVIFFGRPMNLHSLWDTGMIQRMERDWRELAAELEDEITPADAEAWSSLDPIEWTHESYQYSLSHAYPIGDGNLGDEYYAKNQPLMLQRLQQGGVRLALLLESIFKSNDTEAKPAAE